MQFICVYKFRSLPCHILDSLHSSPFMWQRPRCNVHEIIRGEHETQPLRLGSTSDHLGRSHIQTLSTLPLTQ